MSHPHEIRRGLSWPAHSLRCFVLVLLLGPAFPFPQLTGSTVSDDPQQILKRTREATYNLTGSGLQGFICTVRPDWESIYAGGDNRPDDLLPILQNLSFKAEVRSERNTVLIYPGAARSAEELAPRIRASETEIDDVLMGFFAIWSDIAFHSPLPADDGAYQVVEIESGYRLNYKSGDSDWLALIDHRFAVSTLQRTSKTYSGELEMRWDEGRQGLLLAGYEGTSKTGPESDQSSASIKYQEVNGFTLPEIVTVIMPVRSKKVVFPLKFSDYQFHTR